MDVIYNSPLNQAHYLSRRAHNLAKKGCFDEACAKHEEAAGQLLEALKLTENSQAIESIQLQHQYHVKKQQLLRLKKQQLIAVKEAIQAQKEVMSRLMKVRRNTSGSEPEGVLQKEIYRTFEEADSLLELLLPKEGSEGQVADPSTGSRGVKKPKDANVVIEELRVVNGTLRSLITKLMAELASSEKEVASLKKRVAELEKNAEHKASAEQLHFNIDLPPLELPDYEGNHLFK